MISPGPQINKDNEPKEKRCETCTSATAQFTVVTSPSLRSGLEFNLK